MSKRYEKELKRLINFGIDEENNYSKEELFQLRDEFRKNISYELYQDLFQEIEKYILEDNETDKEELILLVIELISCFPQLENSINLFPITIINLYSSYINYKNICILFENIYYSDICSPLRYEEIILKFLAYIEDENNSYFINYCFRKIEKLYNGLIQYLDKKDYENVKYKEIINNPELITMLKNKMNDLNKSL